MLIQLLENTANIAFQAILGVNNSGYPEAGGTLFSISQYGGEIVEIVAASGKKFNLDVQWSIVVNISVFIKFQIRPTLVSCHD